MSWIEEIHEFLLLYHEKVAFEIVYYNNKYV